MQSKFCRLAATLSAALLLAACASTPMPTAKGGFAATGKINIRNGQSSDTAGFKWQGSDRQDVVDFMSPLGNTMAELTIQYQATQPVHAILDQGQRKDEAADPESLLYNLTGMVLPVGGLRWWLRGMAIPDQPFESQLSGISQQGWQIVWSAERQGDAPRRIDLNRDDLHIRIVITDWITDVPASN